MSRNFPTLNYDELLKIVLKYRDGPINKNGGSHDKYQSRRTGNKFVFSKRKQFFLFSIVKKILTKDIGLTEEARKEVEK